MGCSAVGNSTITVIKISWGWKVRVIHKETYLRVFLSCLSNRAKTKEKGDLGLFKLLSSDNQLSSQLMSNIVTIRQLNYVVALL